MAITINWLTKVITIPQADLTPLGGGRYRLDVNAFRLELKDIEDSEDGMAFEVAHRHATEATLSGVTYARQVEIINGYTVTFESTGSPYQVECVGANHNIADVKNVNDVSLIIGNSAGLISVTSGSGLSIEQAAQLQALFELHGLDPAKPLQVSETARSAGTIAQTVSTASGTTTVQRTA